jgi:hypothetical protein
MCFPHARRTEEDVILLVPRLIPDSPFSDGWLKPKVELIQGLVKGQIGQFFSVVVKPLGNVCPSERSPHRLSKGYPMSSISAKKLNSLLYPEY